MQITVSPRKLFGTGWAGGGLWHPNGPLPAHLAAAVCRLPDNYVIWRGRGVTQISSVPFFGSLFCVCVWLCVGDKGAMASPCDPQIDHLHLRSSWNSQKADRPPLPQGVGAAFYISLSLFSSLLSLVVCPKFPVCHWTGWQKKHQKTKAHTHLPSNLTNNHIFTPSNWP